MSGFDSREGLGMEGMDEFEGGKRVFGEQVDEFHRVNWVKR